MEAALVVVPLLIGSVWGKEGGSSIAGISVTCFETKEQCNLDCLMSCFEVDHCNDSPEGMVACAPNVFLMGVLTFLFVICVVACCCTICFCSPCCFCAVYWKKRRDRRNQQNQFLLVQKA